MLSDPVLLWNQLVASYRAACEQEVGGDAAGGQALLENKVVPLAHAWAQVVPLSPSDAKTVLRRLFLDQRLRVQKRLLPVKESAQRPFAKAHATPQASGAERAAIVQMIDTVQATERIAS